MVTATVMKRMAALAGSSHANAHASVASRAPSAAKPSAAKPGTGSKRVAAKGGKSAIASGSSATSKGAGQAPSLSRQAEMREYFEKQRQRSFEQVISLISP